MNLKAFFGDLFAELGSAPIRYALLYDYDTLPHSDGGSVGFITHRRDLQRWVSSVCSVGKRFNVFVRIEKSTLMAVEITLLDKTDGHAVVTLHAVTRPARKYLYSDFRVVEKTTHGVSVRMLSDEHQPLPPIRVLLDEEHPAELSGVVGVPINAAQRLSRTALFAWSRLAYRARPKSGVFFFSGPDGAGKTSAYNRSKATLEAMNVKTTSIKHLFVLLWWIQTKKRGENLDGITIGGKIAKDPARRERKRDRDDATMKWRVRRYVGLVASLLDIVVFGRVYLAICRTKGYTVLVETSPYDRFVKKHRPSFPRTEAFFKHLLPVPYRAFLMHAPAEVITARRDQLYIEEINEYYARMRQITSISRLENRYVEIDTSVSVDTTFTDLFRHFDYGYRST